MTIKIDQSRAEYKQYFTHPVVSELVAKEAASLESGLDILELGVGNGAIIDQLVSNNSRSNYFGVDIDKKCVSFTKKKHPSAVIGNYDVMSDAFFSSLFCKKKYDMAIGNPPFSKVKKSTLLEEHKKLFSFLSQSIIAYDTTSIFMLISLSLLHPGGRLVFVVPRGMLTSEVGAGFRDYLVANHKVERIYDVAADKFSGVEADTNVITITANGTTNNIELISCDDSSAFINRREFIQRADLGFYNKITLLGGLCLDDLPVTVLRGKRKRDSNLIATGGMLHSSSLTSKDSVTKIKTSTYLPSKACDTHAGDILIARVGSRCLGRVGLVLEGQFVASDCLFIVRLESVAHSEELALWLSSELCKSWFASLSRGVGAKYITMKDLLKLPITKDLYEKYT